MSKEKTSKSSKKVRVVPKEVALFESKLNIKFDGPYSDGREWDGWIRAKNQINCMMKLGELAAWLEANKFTKKSDCVSSTFSFKLGKNVHLGIEVGEKDLDLTIYYED